MYKNRVNRKTAIKLESMIKFKKYINSSESPNIVSLGADNILEELREYVLWFGKNINTYRTYEKDEAMLSSVKSVIKDSKNRKDLVNKILLNQHTDNILNIKKYHGFDEGIDLFNFDFCATLTPEIAARALNVVSLNMKNTSIVFFTSALRKVGKEKTNMLYNTIINTYIPYADLSVLDTFGPETYRDYDSATGHLTAAMSYFGIVIKNDKILQKIRNKYGEVTSKLLEFVIENPVNTNEDLCNAINLDKTKLYQLMKILKTNNILTREKISGRESYRHSFKFKYSVTDLGWQLI